MNCITPSGSCGRSTAKRTGAPTTCGADDNHLGCGDTQSSDRPGILYFFICHVIRPTVSMPLHDTSCSYLIAAETREFAQSCTKHMEHPSSRLIWSIIAVFRSEKVNFHFSLFCCQTVPTYLLLWPSCTHGLVS